ncbi:CTP-dependent riboflavin kinase [Candidatus Woesearchaeota archaeon]|nr:CTP-dependent riboflavin kinase [Candidatus Woesearchaeota archaeon]
MDNSTVLLELAKLAKNRSIDSSTLSLSRKLGISQQSVSRKLMELESQKLIKRQVSQRGITVIIDAKGKEVLAQKYASLKQFFEESKPCISGTLKTGLGEGKYYMSQQEYQSQFAEKLGFTAYPGTLNLTVEPTEVLTFINSQAPIRINGFERRERTFGALTAYRARIGKISCSIIIPDRTTHDSSTLEVIAPDYLRDALKIKDGDIITIEGD